MAVSMKNLDPAFQGVGQKVGMEIWRIENFNPVPVAKSDYGKFYSGDSYIILRTTASKSGALRYDIHFWLGEATSQDEAGTAAIKSVELDAALGGRAVQYREVQGYETDKFLTYFKPCIIPLDGGVASGFKKPEVDKYEPRMFVCKGRRVVRVKQVPFSRSSLNHDDVFIVDTESKIYQFNGVNSSIQERAKSLEVVQYIKDNDHSGKCDVAIIEDGKMAAEAEAGEFWGLFGGFAPIGKKGSTRDDAQDDSGDAKLLCVVDGHPKEVAVSPLKPELLETNKSYVLDGGPVLYVWTGRDTSLDERKAATSAAEEYAASQNKPSNIHIVRIIEGFETLTFKAYFEVWTVGSGAVVSEEGRGKVAALLKQQGINVKGLLKGAPVKEDTPSLLDSSGKLEVWRVNGKSKTTVTSTDYGKFYSGDCYIVLYTYQGDQKENENLLSCWLGKQSTVEEQNSALRQIQEMASSLRGRPVQARIVQGKEPPQFIALFQSMIILQGGHSSGYKQLIAESGSEDETYTEDAVALFKVRGTRPYNSQAVQVEPVSTSLNSSDCFILQMSKTLLLWFGSFSTVEEQQVVVQMAACLKPGTSPKSLKEGSEPATFWNALGGKKVYPSQREPKDAEKDPRLFVYTKKKASIVLSFEEIFNYTQDDLLSDDIMILDTQSEVFVWVGQNVDSKDKQQALSIAEKYIERAGALDALSKDTPIYKVLEGSEPEFFSRHFSWDPAKSAVHIDPFERRLAALQGRPVQALDTPPKRRSMGVDVKEGTPTQPETNSVSPKLSQRKSSLAALSSAFNSPSTGTPPKAWKSPAQRDTADQKGTTSPEPEAEGVPVTDAVVDNGDNKKAAPGTYSYESLKVKSLDPATGIDVTKRETYLSPEEFHKVFGIDIEQFRALPKWKQDQYKKAADLF